jgi:23S rRNA pseudouridine1911/1915/1917 synthase
MWIATMPLTPDRPCFFDSRWPVLYIDNHLLAVYKPSGLLVQSDSTADPCLQDLGKQWLKRRYHKPGNVFLAMVHRLDRPVAGVVLFARTSKAAARLSAQFRERSVEKSYRAVVHGRVIQAEGRLIDHIERVDRRSRVVPRPTPHSQEARLTYGVLDRRGDTSLLQVALETGRRHQIRIQLAHMGHPIVGDLRYGAPAPLPYRAVALLAHRLIVEHPTRRERLALVSPMPRGWPWSQAAIPDVPSPPWNWQEFAPTMVAASASTSSDDPPQ